MVVGRVPPWLQPCSAWSRLLLRLREEASPGNSAPPPLGSALPFRRERPDDWPGPPKSALMSAFDCLLFCAVTVGFKFLLSLNFHRMLMGNASDATDGVL